MLAPGSRRPSGHTAPGAPGGRVEERSTCSARSGWVRRRSPSRRSEAEAGLTLLGGSSLKAELDIDWDDPSAGRRAGPGARPPAPGRARRPPAVLAQDRSRTPRGRRGRPGRARDRRYRSPILRAGRRAPPSTAPRRPRRGSRCGRESGQPARTRTRRALRGRSTRPSPPALSSPARAPGRPAARPPPLPPRSGDRPQHRAAHRRGHRAVSRARRTRARRALGSIHEREAMLIAPAPHEALPRAAFVSASVWASAALASLARRAPRPRPRAAPPRNPAPLPLTLSVRRSSLPACDQRFSS